MICMRLRLLEEADQLLILVVMAAAFLCGNVPLAASSAGPRAAPPRDHDDSCAQQLAPPGPCGPSRTGACPAQAAPGFGSEPRHGASAAGSSREELPPERSAPCRTALGKGQRLDMLYKHSQDMIYKQSQQQAKTRLDTREPKAKACDGINFNLGPLCAGRSGDPLGDQQHLLEQGDDNPDEDFFAAAVESMDEATLRKVAAQTLQAMRRLELVPRRATQNRLARAFQRQLPEDVAEAFWTLHSEGGALGKLAHTSLMVAFERSKPERTLRLYEELWPAGIKPNRVTCNSALCAMCQLGHADEALALFKQMSALGETEPGMVPNGKSYGSVLHVCAESGKHSMAVRLFERMVSQGISPNRFAYNDAIASCMRLGKLKQAMLLYEQMRRCGVPPCDNTHRVLIRACSARGLTKEHAYLVEQFKMVKLAEVGAEIAESEGSTDFPEPSDLPETSGNSE